MSLVVDRPGAGAPEPDEVPDGADEAAGASEADAARADRTDGDGAPETPASAVVRVLVAMATLGAAVVHFAFAPEHLGESGTHGAFFLAVGWLQLACAAALAFRARPLRLWLGVTALVDAGVVAVWVLSRTAGVPGSDREPVAFPDTLTTVLEVVAVAGAVALLAGWLARPAATRATATAGDGDGDGGSGTDAPASGGTGGGRLSPLALGVPAVVLAALVTASVTPALAGGHDHGGGAGAHDMAGMDHGHAGSGTGGDAAWNEQRLAALSGYLPEAQVEDFRELNRDYLADQIRQRSDALSALPADEREARIATFVDWSVDNALAGENGSATGEATMHAHGPTVWQPLTDPDDAALLQDQLQQAGEVIARYPTAADAVAGGYQQVTPYVPGIGAHYLNTSLIRHSGFDPAVPEMLLYNGNDPTSHIVGLSYATWGDEPTEGFAGPNDVWHQHPALCSIGTFVVGPDSTPEDMCASIGGEKGVGGRLWMTHLWQVPGWESPWGLFSGENPQINLVTTDVGR